MRTAALICALLIYGLDKPSDAPTPTAENVPVLIRDVRVLIAQDVPRVRFRAASSLELAQPPGAWREIPLSGEWLIVSAAGQGGLRLGKEKTDADSVRLRSPEDRLITLSIRRRGEWKLERTYPGDLEVRARDDGKIDIINYVDVERYVACVVAHEVWPTFDVEAFRAQTIAARTYVLYQMKRRSGATFDVAATQGSQVYKGLRDDPTGRRAAKAAQDTRGVALTFNGDGTPRLFCAYYSAACGGLSQSAAIFGSVNDIKPLSGGVRCTYCKIAPGETYRWGPVTIPLEEMRDRLVAAYPELKSLGELSDIEVMERTPSRRPIRLRLIGSSGETHDMLAERFRLAINGSLIRSTDFRLRVRRGNAIFDRGRGFGHGLGLCQWGMQGQALAGKHAGDILRYYYPGAALTRVY